MRAHFSLVHRRSRSYYFSQYNHNNKVRWTNKRETNKWMKKKLQFYRWNRRKRSGWYLFTIISFYSISPERLSSKDPFVLHLGTEQHLKPTSMKWSDTHTRSLRFSSFAFHCFFLAFPRDFDSFLFYITDARYSFRL